MKSIGLVMLLAIRVFLIEGYAATPPLEEIDTAQELLAESDPTNDDIVAQRKVGEAYRKRYLRSHGQEDLTIAMQAYTKLYALDPIPAKTKFTLYSLLVQAALFHEDADALVRARRLFHSSPVFKQAAMLPPSLVQAYMLQDEERHQGDFALVKWLLKKAITESPLHTEARVMLSKLYSYDEKLDLSNLLAEQVLALDGRNHRALEQLAVNGLQQIEQLDCKASARQQILSTIKSYKSVLQHQPRSVGAHTDIAWLYKLAGRSELYLFEAKRALDLDDSLNNVSNYAAALLWGGRWEEAQRQYLSLLQSQPNDPEVLRDVYMLYFVKNDWVRANEIWDQYKQHERDFYFYGYLRQYLTLAKLYGAGVARTFLQGAVTDQTLTPWQNAIFRYITDQAPPDDLLSLAVTSCDQTEAKYYIGLKQSANGDEGAARVYFEAVKNLQVYSFNEYLSAVYALGYL